MSLDTRRAFAFMRMNYKYGLLDKTASLMGEALEGAMDELGLDFEDVLMRLDGAGEDTIDRINGAVEKWSGLALRLAVNEHHDPPAGEAAGRPRGQAAPGLADHGRAW